MAKDGSFVKCIVSMLVVASTICVVLLILLLLNLKKGDIEPCVGAKSNPATTESKSNPATTESSPDGDDEVPTTPRPSKGDREYEGSLPPSPILEGCWPAPDGGNKSACYSRGCRREAWSQVFMAPEESPCENFYKFACGRHPHDSYRELIHTPYLDSIILAGIVPEMTLARFMVPCERMKAQHLNRNKLDLPEDVASLLAYLTLLQINPFFDVDVGDMGQYVLRKPSYVGESVLTNEILAKDGGEHDKLNASSLDSSSDLWRQVIHQLNPSLNDSSAQVIDEAPSYFANLILEYFNNATYITSKIRQSIHQYWHSRFWEVLNDSEGRKLGCVKLADQVIRRQVRENFRRIFLSEFENARENMIQLVDAAKKELAEFLGCRGNNTKIQADIIRQLSAVKLLGFESSSDSHDDDYMFSNDSFLQDTLNIQIKEARLKYKGGRQAYQHLRSIAYIKNISAIYIPWEYYKLIMANDVPSYVTVAKIGFELTRALIQAVNLPAFDREDAIVSSAVEEQNPLQGHEVWDELLENHEIRMKDLVAVKTAFNMAFRSNTTQRLHVCFSPQQQFFITMMQQFCVPDLQPLAERALYRPDLTPNPFRLSLALSTFRTFLNTFECESHITDKCIH